jgi:hypothetical protein
MELLLNSLWVLIVLSAVSVWRFCWAPQKRERGRNWVQEWAAFVCALVLLFFAVSLTDDLHANLVCFDECASARRQSIITSTIASPHTLNFTTGSGTVAPARQPLFGSLRVIRTIAVFEQPPVSPCARSFDSCRAPPVSVL